MRPHVLSHCFAALLATALAGALTLSCGPLEEETPPPGEEVRSDKQRVVSPKVDPADFSKQMSANGALAVDLYQQLRKSATDNMFFSPHSISMALAMLYAGAAGNTEAEMAKALHFDLAQAKLHPVLNKLDQDLASRGKGKKGADGGKFRLNVLNSIWGQRDYAFQAPFLDTLALNYGAGLRLLDFVAQPDASRKAINQWVEDKTEKRIKDLLPQGSVSTLTRLVLTNAVYFNAAWAEPFEDKDTAKGTFNLYGGGVVTADMMSSKQTARAMEGAGFSAVALPYDGHELAMLMVVPDQGTFATFEKSLSAKSLADDIVGKLTERMVTLKMPRFEFTRKVSLKSTLEALGMKEAFTPKADLSGIDGTKTLQVTGVFHKAFVKVNEKGTEAAAATGVVVGKTSAPKPMKLTIDRPFIFLIRDLRTGAVLFVGRVMDPTK